MGSIIDYAVRCLTTGDEEEWQLEGNSSAPYVRTLRARGASPEEIEEFKVLWKSFQEGLRKGEVVDGDELLRLFEPYVTDPELYRAHNVLWENKVVFPEDYTPEDFEDEELLEFRQTYRWLGRRVPPDLAEELRERGLEKEPKGLDLSGLDLDSQIRALQLWWRSEKEEY